MTPEEEKKCRSASWRQYIKPPPESKTSAIGTRLHEIASVATQPSSAAKGDSDG